MESAWTRGDFVSPEWFDFILHWIALIIETGGVAGIAIGFQIAFLAAIRHVIRREEWAEIVAQGEDSRERAIA